MPKVSVVKGTTSYLARIFIQDSSSTVGAGLTGLVFNTSNLVCYQARDDDGNAGGTAVALVTATLGTWTSKGFKEKDATNMPGVYEFGVPNAGLATGSKTVTFMFKGAANMAPLVLEIELTAVDNQDAVRFALTALPNAAAEAAGGLYTRGTGAGQIKQTNNGEIDSNATHINNVATSPVTTINANQGTTQPVNFTGTGASALAKADTVDWAGNAVAAAAAGIPKVDIDTIKTNAVVNAGTVTFPTTATLASTTNITAGTITTATNLTNAPTAGDFTATMKTSLNASTPNALRTGTAQAGAATTITLDSGANANNNYYNNTLILLTGSTGAGQARFISAYNGSTKVATVSTWVTNPDNTTTFSILGFDAVAGASAPTTAQIATAVWQDLLASSDFSTASSIGALLKTDIDAQLSLIKTQTDKLTFTVANQVDSNVLDWKSATAPAMTGDAYARIGAAGAGLTALGDSRIGNLDQAISSLFTTVMTESYGANGAAPTPAQALFLIMQALTEFAISGTTVTIKKKDHSATAATLTLDDGTNPTSTTRAT